MLVSCAKEPRLDARSLDTQFVPRQIFPDLKEKCGVVGVHSPHYPISVKYLLYGLQHRGQQAAGMVFWNRNKNKWFKKRGQGLIREAFRPPRPTSRMGYSAPIKEVTETIGLGHTRYSTCGGDEKSNIQPIIRGNVAWAHNGNIANYDELRARVGTMHGTTDTEVIALLVDDARHKGRGFVDAVRHVEPQLQGSYSLLALDVEENGHKRTRPIMYGIRDPLGVRPLKFGELVNEEHLGWLFVSEDCTLSEDDELVHAAGVRDVNPGEIVAVYDDHFECHPCPPELQKQKATCYFEYLYFARPSSTIDGILVKNARKTVGALISRRAPDATVISSVPDSGRPMAEGMAKHLGMFYTDIFDVNKYTGRSFIWGTEDERRYAINLKLQPIRDEVKNQSVLLCDDSIVRNLTAEIATQKLKKSGAKKVYWAISSPPIIAPCFLGMDYPTYSELGVYDYLKTHPKYDPRRHKDVDAIGTWMAERIGADGVIYAYIDEIDFAIPTGTCKGCITNQYPIDVPDSLRHGNYATC